MGVPLQYRVQDDSIRALSSEKKAQWDSHSFLAEGSPGKIHLNHSNEKAAGIIFLPAFNDCRRRDLLAFALHRELREEREGPTEVSGRIGGMV